MAAATPASTVHRRDDVALLVDVAVLCQSCGDPVPLALFVLDVTPRRQVACPGCTRDLVLHDAW